MDRDEAAAGNPAADPARLPATDQGSRRPALGRKQLDKLTPTDVRRLVEAKAESGLTVATIKQIHELIRNALAGAEREELVHRNVAKLVKPPAVRRKRRGSSRSRRPSGCST